ncbi:PaaI family thioesterase [Actinomadura fibrosa]|uniref:Hotdog domain-containing protein n=1 Tax=Actinomadura fibrosa TaxID=111802 RepID=A0ABW2XSL1_9ACTN|nr:hotdog domain-containing protein [Actinomadura fibrosa]
MPTGTAGSRSHILRELGLSAVRDGGGGMRGSAPVTPPMHVPGTPRLRTSILATWADTLTGLLAADALAPRVPVTVDLDVHLFRPAPESGTVLAAARTLKAGRSIVVADVEFASARGEPFAVATGSFVSAPDPALRLPERLTLDAPPPEQRLAVPLAERAGCRRTGPGTAVLPRSGDGLNASGTVNGGLIALAAEEAVLSLAPGTALCSLHLRYLQPVRVGPVVATARPHGGLARVDVRDAGGGDRLSVAATARTEAAR